RTILPAPRIRARRGGLTGWILAVLERAILERRGRRVWIATAVAILLALAGILQIRTYGSTREYMARNSLPRQHLAEIERHFPATITMTILYEGPPDSVKQLGELRHIDGLRSELEADPLVWPTASLVDLVKML